MRLFELLHEVKAEAEFNNFWNRISSCFISVLCHVTARAVSKNIKSEKRAQSGIILLIS